MSIKTIYKSVALQVWFSVQSDFGITLGELGKLASNTDSKLIASTLQALKDIVSVEASSGESQFMTGAVETSSFGTFAISSGGDAKLVMSYIISVSNNETVPEEMEKTIQMITTNFGKQLTQLKNIGELAKMGAMIPRDFIYQAFVNSITIVQLETKVKKNAKQLDQDIDRAIDDIFDNNELVSEYVTDIFDEKFMKSKDNWFAGYPSKIARSNFLEEFSKKVLIFATIDNPMLLINSTGPRIEHRRVMTKLFEKFTKSSEDFNRIMSEQFDDYKKKDFENYISTLSLFQLHMVEEMTYNEFLRRTLIEISKIKPSVFFYKFDKARVRAILQSKIPVLTVPNFGEIMTEIVTKFAPPHTWNLVKTFYDTLISDMIGTKFSTSAVDMGLLFAQYFIEPDNLKKQIAKDKRLKKQWKEELINLTPEEKITSLEVDSIEEAVLLSNAAGNTIVNVFVKILNQYFIGGETHHGELIDRFCTFYNETSPKIKTSTILLSLLEILEKIDEDINFVTPTVIDIIITYMMEHNSEFMVGEELFKTNKKLFGPYVAESKNETTDLLKKIHEIDSFDLIVGEEKISIDLSKFSISDLPVLVTDENRIIQGVDIGMQRKLENIIKPVLIDFKDQIIVQLEEFKTKCENDKFSTRDLNLLKIDIPKFNFNAISYGEYIHGLNLEFVKSLRDFFENHFPQFIKELVSKMDGGNKLSKNVKMVNKYIQNFGKYVDENIADYEKSVIERISEVMKSVKRYTKPIRKVLDITKDDIFHYNMDSPSLVEPPSSIEPKMLDFIKREIGFGNFDEESLKFNLGVKLFDSVSNTAFEKTFDQIIQDKMENRIKEIRNNSSTIAEFETQLRDMGRVEAFELYEILGKIIDRCTEFYVKKDGVVTMASDFLKLHLGRLALSKYSRKELITNLIKSPNLVVERDGDSWLISYGFTKIMRNDTSIPNIITFKDTTHYVIKRQLMDDLNEILLALQEVGKLIENETYYRLEEMKNELFNVIYVED